MKRRADGEGTYYHDKDKNMWRYTIIVAGKHKSFSATGKSAKAAAKAKCTEWLKERDGVAVSVSADMKLEPWIKMYLENCRKGTMKDTSYHQLELLANDLPPELKNKKVCVITPIEVQAFLNKFSSKASKSYVDKMAGLLKALFGEAQENGLCVKNPTRKLKVPKINQDPKQSFTSLEVSAICEFAQIYHRDIKANALAKRAGLMIGVAVTTLLLTGLRRGELLGLMWNDIKDNKLTVNRAVFLEKNKETEKYHPIVREYEAKTEKSLRTIPLPQKAKEAIEKLPHRGLYIFSSESGGIMNPRNFNRSYDTFFKNLYTEHKEVRRLKVHECRHTCATLMLESGVDMRIVQEILGHEDIKTTAGYMHPDFATMGKASERFLNSIWCVNKCGSQVKISSKE
jgi:integrase